MILKSHFQVLREKLVIWGSQGHQESLDPKVQKARKGTRVGNYIHFMTKHKRYSTFCIIFQESNLLSKYQIFACGSTFKNVKSW